MSLGGLAFLQQRSTEAERVAAWNEKSASESKYRSLFEHSIDAISVTTPDGKLVDVNQPWLDLFGYTSEDVERLDTRDLCAEPAERDKIRHQLAECGQIKDRRIDLVGKEGRRFTCLLSIQSHADKVSQQRRSYAIFRDITESLDLEQQLRQSQKNGEHRSTCLWSGARLQQSDDRYYRLHGARPRRKGTTAARWRGISNK